MRRLWIWGKRQRFFSEYAAAISGESHITNHKVSIKDFFSSRGYICLFSF